MVVLKDKLARKYEGNSSRKTFSEDNLWKEPYDVMAEYPVILSTTFSSRNSLNSDVVYDYLIMDEASQVDIATGALALSCNSSFYYYSQHEWILIYLVKIFQRNVCIRSTSS